MESNKKVLIKNKEALVENITFGEADTEDESIKDTLKDLANYAIMGIMELEEYKNE